MNDMPGGAGDLQLFMQSSSTLLDCEGQELLGKDLHIQLLHLAQNAWHLKFNLWKFYDQKQ